jgi:hypothetical protein
MKYKNKFSLLTLLAAILFASCNKELDIKPTDIIAADNSFINMEDLQRGVNGIFGRYLTKVNFNYASALCADEVKFGRDNSGQGRFTYTYTTSPDNTGGGDLNACWGGMPTVIQQCNIVLQYADVVPAANSFEQGRRPILKAQALAMRALAHFDLLQAYSGKYNPTSLGVPYITAFNPQQKPSRPTAQVTMDAIENDLNQARLLLPATTTGNFNDTTIHQLTITAIQARIALYKGEWQRASDLATTVINANIKPIVSGTAYAGIWTDQNQNEILFRIRQINASSTSVANGWTTGNLIYFAPSDKLTATYATNDVRLSAFIATGAPGGGATARYVNKFFNSPKGPRVVDLKVIRISEMYLIRAEAQAELNNLTAGAADLNLLRSNRITGYVNETFNNKTDLINAIINERYKELCYEGFRFWDLKRRSLPVSRLLSDTDNNTTWQNLPADNFRFTFPIPLPEILGNPNMQQNPGWN